MRKFILALAILSSAVVVDAADLIKKGGVAVQGAGVDGFKSAILGAASVTYDMSDWVWWELYVPTTTTCKYRITPTSSRGAYVQHSAPADTKVGYVVSGKTPFVHFSSCSPGELKGF